MPLKLLPLSAIYLVSALLMIVTTRFALAVPIPPPFWKWRLPDKIEHLHWAWRAVIAGLAIAAALNLMLTGLSRIQVSIWTDLRPIYLLAAVAGVAVVATQFIDSRPRRYAIVVAAAVVAIAWYVYPGWLTIDAISCIMAIYFLLVAQPLVTFWTLAIVELLLAVGYDLVSVFYTSNMLRYAHNAITANLPGLILIPSQLSLSSQLADAIGIGDIIIPALLVLSAGRLAQRAQCPAIYYWALGGFAAGLLAALLVLSLTGAAQPATIFTVPATVAASIYAAYRHQLQAELKVKLVPGPQPHW